MCSLNQKKNTIAFLKYAVVFFVSILTIFLITISSCLIPHEWTKDNTIKSVEETENEIMAMATQGKSKPYEQFEMFGDIRNYAMIFYTNESDPVRSAVEMNYGMLCDYPELCADAMKGVVEGSDEQTMISYNRYWQGQSVVLHFLTIFGSFLNTRTFLTIVFIILTAFVVYRLFKEDKKLAIAFAVGLSSIDTVFMTRSLEFLPVMFVLMIAILLVLKARKNGGEHLGIVFLIMGVLTCYLDFLTCETIVLSVPLIIYVYLNIKEGKGIKMKKLLFLILMWGIGYAGAFIMKWLISYLFIGDDVIKDITENTVGHSLKGSLLEKIIAPINLSFSKLLPFALFGENGGIYALILFIICFIYTLRKNKKYLPLFMICLIPVLRFSVINAHSIQLNYFTYRAFLCIAIVMALTTVDIIAKKIAMLRTKG